MRPSLGTSRLRCSLRTTRPGGSWSVCRKLPIFTCIPWAIFTRVVKAGLPRPRSIWLMPPTLTPAALARPSIDIPRPIRIKRTNWPSDRASARALSSPLNGLSPCVGAPFGAPTPPGGSSDSVGRWPPAADAVAARGPDASPPLGGCGPSVTSSWYFILLKEPSLYVMLAQSTLLGTERG